MQRGGDAKLPAKTVVSRFYYSNKSHFVKLDFRLWKLDVGLDVIEASASEAEALLFSHLKSDV